MQQSEVDDWDTFGDVPIILQANIVEPAFNDEEETVQPAIRAFHVAPARVEQVGPAGHRSADLEDLAIKSIPIFKNSGINASAQVRLVGDLYKLRIFGQLNKLWHVANLERHLKSAIDFYDKSSKATTTKANHKQIDILVKAIDRLNGIISATSQQLRLNPGDESARIRLRETTEAKSTLEREQQSLLAVSVDEKKNDVNELKKVSEKLLRILSKDDSRSRALHHILIRKVNPEGYARQLVENAELARIAEEQKQFAYNSRREQSRIDRIVDGFTHVDKANYMIARELHMQGKHIPRDLQRYIMVIDHSPYLTFRTELTKPVSAKVILTSTGSDHQYKKQFPTVGATVQPNAWTQKLGTKVEDKPIVRGAWVAPIDTEMLKNLPDPPKVVVERKQPTYIQTAEEDDEWESYQYCTNDDSEW